MIGNLEPPEVTGTIPLPAPPAATPPEQPSGAPGR